MNQRKMVCAVLSMYKAGNGKSSRGEKREQQERRSSMTTSTATSAASLAESIIPSSEPIDCPARSIQEQDLDTIYQEEVQHYNAKTWGMYNRIAASRTKNASKNSLSSRKDTSNRKKDCHNRKSKHSQDSYLAITEREGIFDFES